MLLRWMAKKNCEFHVAKTSGKETKRAPKEKTIGQYWKKDCLKLGLTLPEENILVRAVEIVGELPHKSCREHRPDKGRRGITSSQVTSSHIKSSHAMSSLVKSSQVVASLRSCQSLYFIVILQCLWGAWTMHFTKCIYFNACQTDSWFLYSETISDILQLFIFYAL